jgi:two-component system, chemotaxis family, CheB/CheR fusion protein
MTKSSTPPQGSTHEPHASVKASEASALDAEKVPVRLAPLIVGIGASAGGLEAFKTFFLNMPADGEFAFVLVQHLSPTHDSMLAELVGRHTTMPVTEAHDGEHVVPGHVYVIPPDATLTIADGVLQVSTPAPPRQHRWPINTFFTSLAEDRGDCAVCIVLSGTGSDGALGLRAIKERGGLTLAQSGFDHVAMSGMPASAASTGLVDDILPVEDMPARLLAYRKNMHAARQHQDADGIRQDVGDHLQTLCQLLRAEVGHDFSQYKRSTLLRRIQRRMLVRQTETVHDYIKYLKENPQEHQQLFREMLIGVTEFFRDPKAFAALQSEAIPAMLAEKDAGEVLRIWVPGCATGEEAYSIAMMVREAADSSNGPKVQIFATDIDDRAISAARAGRYRAPLHGVSEERRERWFRKEGDDYCVIKQLREMCVFSPHSVIKDPPFSRLDMVSCRNLLIYLNADLQERLLQTFHYALRPGGFLLLGPSESLSRCARLFTEVDKKHRLYVRRENNRVSGTPSFPVPERAEVQGRRGTSSTAAFEASARIDRNIRHVLERYTPSYVLVDTNHDVVRFVGDTGRYLSPSTGAASLNVFGLLQKRLREPARSVVRQAFASAGAGVRGNLSAQIDGHQQLLRLIAEPLAGDDGKIALCMLVFEQDTTPSIPSNTPDGPLSAELVRNQALEHELESARIQLHMAIELHESANEELKSANEEYQSVNEELQSANEELETSKEEMQSINEELQIINAEGNSKNETLARLHSDLINLMDSTQIATMFLDRDMRIGGYTPAMTDLFHLREGDRGRPITEISPRINYPELKQDIADVLRHLSVIERTLFGTADEPVYLMRMRAYRTVDHVIDGVVLTFVDVTQSQRHEVERGQLAAIVDFSMDAIIGYTLEDTITSWNASAVRIFGHPAVEAIGQPLSMLLPADASEEAKAILATGERRERPQVFETVWCKCDGFPIAVAVTNSPVRNAEGQIIAGSLIARDITERRHAEKHTRMMLGELNHRVKNTLASIQAIALQTLAYSPSLQDFRTSFLARLRALSLTHNLLAVEAWNGVDLTALVLSELAPYHDEHQLARVKVHGEDLHLTPKTALALSMALHELTTNALKYGALSVLQGSVDVSWETREIDHLPWLHLCWQETDGPEVQTPSSHGFGARLIVEGLAFELDGHVALDFEPTGVRCTIDVPLSSLESAQ